MRALTRLTSGLMVFIGLAILVRTVQAGGGPAALGIVFGLLFIAAGGGRLYLDRQRGDDREEDDR